MSLRKIVTAAALLAAAFVATVAATGAASAAAPVQPQFHYCLEGDC